jgi:Effector-associated domain 1
VAFDEFAEIESREAYRASATWIVVFDGPTTEEELQRIERVLGQASGDVEPREITDRSAALRVGNAERAVLLAALQPFGSRWRILTEGEWREQRSSNVLAVMVAAAQILRESWQPLMEVVRNTASGLPDSGLRTADTADERGPEQHGAWDNHRRMALRDALRSAFPHFDDLDMELDLHLDRRLADYALGANSLEAAYWRLIKGAIADGWVDDLLCGALRSKPRNPALQQLVADSAAQCAGCRVPREHARCPRLDPLPR